MTVAAIRKRLLIAGFVGLAFVALVSFATSFHHQSELARRIGGHTGVWAYALPLMLDGMIISVAVLYAIESCDPEPELWWYRTAIILASIGTLAFNWRWAEAGPWAWAMAVTPPIALIVVLESVLLTVRKYLRRLSETVDETPETVLETPETVLETASETPETVLETASETSETGHETVTEVVETPETPVSQAKRLKAQGKTADEIAFDLGVSRSTVFRYLAKGGEE